MREGVIGDERMKEYGILDVYIAVLNENLKKYGNLEQILNEKLGKIELKIELSTKCARGCALCAYTREEKLN